MRIIAPPTVACWLSKYNGEIVALGIIFPFDDCLAEKVSGDSPALFTIGSLSRFINCSWPVARSAVHVGQTFLSDRARTVGNLMGLIADDGGPSSTGGGPELSHLYGWQMIQAPQFTAQQNGLAGRAVISFAIDVKNIFSLRKAHVHVRKFRLNR